jgi:hypothetical protein
MIKLCTAVLIKVTENEDVGKVMQVLRIFQYYRIVDKTDISGSVTAAMGFF